MTPGLARSLWAAVEHDRLPGESWIASCERQILSAMRDEGLTQVKIAEVMSVQQSTINRALRSYDMATRPPRRRPALAHWRVA